VRGLRGAEVVVHIGMDFGINIKSESDRQFIGEVAFSAPGT
jgi:hypothetical protein